MGRRIEPGGRVTWYDRVDGETAGKLGIVLGALQRHDAAQAALEVTTVHGRPVQLRVQRRRARARRARAAGPGQLARRPRDAPRRASARAPGGHGRRLEAEVSLDLTDPANLAAVQDVVQMLGLRAPPTDWPRRVRALAARLDADGAVDVRVFRERLDQSTPRRGRRPAPVRAGYDRTAEARDLLAGVVAALGRALAGARGLRPRVTVPLTRRTS